jgi:hypothetical protein
MLLVTPTATAHHGFEYRSSNNGVTDYKGFVVDPTKQDLRGSTRISFANASKNGFYYGTSDFSAVALSATSVINIAKGFGFYKAPGAAALTFVSKIAGTSVSVALGNVVADTFYTLEFRVVGATRIDIWVNGVKSSLDFTVGTLPAPTDLLGISWAMTCNDTSQSPMNWARAFSGQVRG